MIVRRFHVAIAGLLVVGSVTAAVLIAHNQAADAAASTVTGAHHSIPSSSATSRGPHSTGSPEASSTPDPTGTPGPGGATGAPKVSSSAGGSAGGGSSVTFAGSSTVLIGGSMTDTSATAAPFDGRYAYVHSTPAPSSDYYTAAKCQAAWSSWWGCWDGPTTPPGYFVTWTDNHVAQATYKGSPRPQVQLWTWYSLVDVARLGGFTEAMGEVGAINRADLMTLYLNDYRFFLQKIGTAHELIDLEPDFWGFVNATGNPHQVPAQVTAANPTDCGSQENSASGLAQCLIAMAHKYAPNTKVGLHLTCWNWQSNVPGCVKDYASLGAQNADFLVSDVVDRDAGWYALPANGGSNTFWSDQKAQAAMAYYKALAVSVGKPVVLWQIPLGNMSQNNTTNHYQDDKVDWLFAHMDQVAAAHIAGLFFGPGEGAQTTVESDGGNLISKTIAYRTAGGVALK